METHFPRLPATKRHPKKKADKMAVPQISKDMPITIKLGAVFSLLSFTAWATWRVSDFMHDSRQFQSEVREIVEKNREGVSSLRTKLDIVAVRQVEVMGDRWRATDMRTWLYELERANRDVQRPNGSGLIVPMPPVPTVTGSGP